MAIRNLRVSPDGATGEVRSNTDHKVWYTVVKSADGSGRCQCKWNLIKQQECRHLDEFLTAVRIKEMQESWEPALYEIRFRWGKHYRRAIVLATSETSAVHKLRMEGFQPRIAVIVSAARLHDDVYITQTTSVY